jgi:hypothetical protein
VEIRDFPMDDRKKGVLTWDLSADDPDNVTTYFIYRTRSAEEIQSRIADERNKFIAAARTDATEARLGENWADRITDLSDADRSSIRDLRQAAATAAAPAFEATEDADAAAEINVWMFIGTAKPGETRYIVDKLEMEDKDENPVSYSFMVRAIAPDLSRSTGVETATSLTPEIELFFGNPVLPGGRFWLAWIVVIFCGAVVYWIRHAKSGKPIKLRKIAGLEAVDEAVGRATEMGRSCLYVPGIQDMNDIQTIASITILSRVAKTAAEYDAKIEIPTARSLVMTTARETVQASYLTAGKPDAYNQDLIYYVTDEQFGYVAYLSGMMVREKPAACFYMGCFYAESLILAETGNAIGAIQIAGTAMPAQLPFFVAACDYTLIGEEFFAASAYLSGSPEELGSLKGQDLGKILVAVMMLVGITMYTLATVLGADSGMGATLNNAVAFIKGVILT